MISRKSPETGQRFKTLRERMGIASQSEFARRIHMRQTTYHRTEGGSTPSPAATALAAAHLFEDPAAVASWLMAVGPEPAWISDVTKPIPEGPTPGTRHRGCQGCEAAPAESDEPERVVVRRPRASFERAEPARPVALAGVGAQLRRLIREAAQGERSVSISRELLGILTAAKPPGAKGYLFVRPDGVLPNRRWFWEVLERARREAGLGHVTFHVLRHTRASWLVQGGCPIPKVARDMGHSVQTCLNHYVGLTDGYDPDFERAA